MIWLLPWEEEGDARHMPWATWTLLLVNMVVFMMMWAGNDADRRATIDAYGLVSGDWHWYQFITANYLHGGWMHVLGNMFFLWIFGDNVEDALGTAGFLLVYVLGGLAGDWLYVTANDSMIRSIGASGCIAAIAGAYAVLFSSRSISLKVIFIVFPVYTFHLAAVWVLLFWFGMDIYQTVEGKGALEGQGGVNYVAHGAGFLFGAAVGIVALVTGVMRRYEKCANGDGWWGYWPMDLEAKARRAHAIATKHQRRPPDRQW